MVDLDDHIVESILTEQAVASCTWRERDGAVVAAVGRILAPAVGGADSTDRKRGSGSRQAVGAPP